MIPILIIRVQRVHMKLLFSARRERKWMPPEPQLCDPI